MSRFLHLSAFISLLFPSLFYTELIIFIPLTYVLGIVSSLLCRAKREVVPKHLETSKTYTVPHLRRL